MSGVLRWEDPPEANGLRRPNAPRRTKHWAAAAAELRQQPGRWAVVLETADWSAASAVSTQIKRGLLVAFRPAGSFDAVCRTDGLYRIYARHIEGPQS